MIPNTPVALQVDSSPEPEPNLGSRCGCCCSDQPLIQYCTQSKSSSYLIEATDALKKDRGLTDYEKSQLEYKEQTKIASDSSPETEEEKIATLAAQLTPEETKVMCHYLNRSFNGKESRDLYMRKNFNDRVNAFLESRENKGDSIMGLIANCNSLQKRHVETSVAPIAQDVIIETPRVDGVITNAEAKLLSVYLGSEFKTAEERYKWKQRNLSDWINARLERTDASEEMIIGALLKKSLDCRQTATLQKSMPDGHIRHKQAAREGTEVGNRINGDIVGSREQTLQISPQKRSTVQKQGTGSSV